MKLRVALYQSERLYVVDWHMCFLEPEDKASDFAELGYFLATTFLIDVSAGDYETTPLRVPFKLITPIKKE